MARTPEQNAALRDATRETIERAAVRVFAKHGFAASSIRHIADEAGLSTGSIYRHHPGKEALFDALLDRASTGLLAASSALSSDADPLTLIRHFTSTFLNDVASENGEAEFFLVVNHAFLTDTPVGTAKRLASSQRPLWDAFGSLVSRGQASGQFTDGDPAHLTACYFAMLSGITGMRKVIPDAPIEIGVEIVLRLLVEKGPV